MLYRRPTARYRRSPYPPKQAPTANTIDSDILREIEKIPLPNEAEKKDRFVTASDESRGLPALNVFGRNFFIDDLILIGLIFLLLQEKIEDEFLLIILAYILLF